MSKISIQQVFSETKNHSVPLNIGNVNNCDINLIKVQGNYPWHSHEDRDKMIFVMKGNFKICLEDREINLSEGESLIIPRRVMHSAVAEPEAWIMLIE